jgi:hypothetical protein
MYQVRDAKRRIEYLAELRAKNPTWPEERLVAELRVETGVSGRTAKEYVKLLKETGRW